MANNRKDNFSMGYFCACANMIRDYGLSTEVEECLRSNYMTIDRMRKIGVDESDIEILRPAIKEIERKQN